MVYDIWSLILYCFTKKRSFKTCAIYNGYKSTKGMSIYYNGWVIILIVDYAILYLKNQHLFRTLSEGGEGLKRECAHHSYENVDNCGRPLRQTR